ncbi:hypothetical protein NQZ68_008657 [Dissostichus eleginoides]|nr:hypothetical protein NQZ68_008657 [Dissostichus eleginoides]
MEVTDNVNATGSGHKRTVDQVRLRWKNLKQQATKDHSQAKNPQTDEVLLTHVDPEPSARPDDTLQEPPRKRKCKRTRQTTRAEG